MKSKLQDLKANVIKEADCKCDKNKFRDKFIDYLDEVYQDNVLDIYDNSCNNNELLNVLRDLEETFDRLWKEHMEDITIPTKSKLFPKP